MVMILTLQLSLLAHLLRTRAWGVSTYRRVSLFWHLNDLVLYTLFVSD
jgi:hypothetical protein